MSCYSCGYRCTDCWCEHQKTIMRWARQVFGAKPEGEPVLDFAYRLTQRADEEMQELLGTFSEYNMHQPIKQGAEIADIVIILYQVADALGLDLHKCINEKMVINRKRKWITAGNGVGQHE